MQFHFHYTKRWTNITPSSMVNLNSCYSMVCLFACFVLVAIIIISSGNSTSLHGGRIHFAPVNITDKKSFEHSSLIFAFGHLSERWVKLEQETMMTYSRFTGLLMIFTDFEEVRICENGQKCVLQKTFNIFHIRSLWNDIRLVFSYSFIVSNVKK